MSQMTTSSEVKIDDVGPTKKRLTITVPAETINEKLGTQMAALATETSLPGFRKGRAPKKLLERRFGSAVRSETKTQLIADAYAKAVEEHNVKAIGEPEPAEFFDIEKLEVETGKPLTFAVEIEVAPEVDLPNIEGIEIKKPVLEITDEMIEKEMLAQRLRAGTPHEIKEKFEDGDRLVGSAIVTKDGEDEPFFRTDETYIVHPGAENEGRGQVLGVLIDDLADTLTAAKVGDTLSFKTKGPEAHEREDLRGADITIDFRVKTAIRIKPAEMQSVLEEYGIDSDDILREQIKLALEQRRDQEVADAMRTQIQDYLVDSTDFALPERLSEAQAARSLEQARLNMLQRGVTEEQVEQRLAEMRSASEAESQRNLKLFFILHKLAEQFEIQVTEQEINGRIAMMAAGYGMRPEQLRNDLAKRGALTNVAMQIREQKAADRIVAQAKVDDISVDAWQEMQLERRAARGGGAKTTTKKTTTKKTTAKKPASAGSSSKKTTTKKKTSSKKKTSKK